MILLICSTCAVCSAITSINVPLDKPIVAYCECGEVIKLSVSKASMTKPNVSKSSFKRTNTTNTSGVTGVSFSRAQRLWKAQVYHNKKQVYLGWSVDFVEAVAIRCAYDQCMGKGTSPAINYMINYVKEAHHDGSS